MLEVKDSKRLMSLDCVKRQSAEMSSQLNGNVPNDNCRVHYGKTETVTSIVYSPETHL